MCRIGLLEPKVRVLNSLGDTMKTTESLCDALSSSCSFFMTHLSICVADSKLRKGVFPALRHPWLSFFSLFGAWNPIGRHGSRADTCYCLLSLQPSVSVSLRWTMQSDSFSSYDEFASGKVHLGFLSHTQLFCICAVGPGHFISMILVHP